MDEEKREKRNEEIVVLDEGIDAEAMPGTAGLCCSGAFTPFRM